MKKKDSLAKVNCAEIEELLIKRSISAENLINSEHAALKGHLTTCENCANYQSVLLNMERSVDIENEFGFIPASGIKKKLLAKLPAQNKVVYKIDSTWRSFFDFLRIQIPVYQAILGALLIFMIFYAISDFSLSDEDKFEETEATAYIERPIVDSLTMMQNIKLLENQKLGRNIKEDSLLIRFIVTSVDLF